MEQKNDQLKEQDKKPLDKKEELEETQQSGEEIIDGANQNDQLVKLKQSANMEKIRPERPAGALPNTYIPPEQREKS